MRIDLAATGALTERRELLRLTMAGAVDAGKSSLIARLLLDARSPSGDPVRDVAGGTDADRDSDPDLAAGIDELRVEREQAITIDVAYRFLSTERRSFIVGDNPGRERAGAMFSGAATADVVVLVVDALRGVVAQTHRHAHIATLLGVRQLVVCVNKMDLVDWAPEHFGEVGEQLHAMARRLEIREPAVIPTSALHGDNITARSPRTTYYDGPTLLSCLEEIHVRDERDRTRLRLPVQWVGRTQRDGARVYGGRLAGGTLHVGDEVITLPAGAKTRIASLATLEPRRDEAVPPMAVSVALSDQLELCRGDMLASPQDPPRATRELEATICWASEEPMRAGRRYALRHISRTVRATVQTIHDRIDPQTLERQPGPSQLELDDVGTATLRTSSVVFAEPLSMNRMTAVITLIDERSGDAVGAGVVSHVRAVAPERGGRRHLTWHPSKLDRHQRWATLDQRGGTVLLTGLPASGKSTIAAALERHLVERRQSAYLLDGDNVRQGLSDDLGFSPGDRSEHIRRVGHVARMFADSGAVAVVSLIAPLAADRADLRRGHAEAALPFVEVFVDTPLKECERRDPKGLYARARAGEIEGFTGIDAPYEPPENPEVHIRTAEIGVEEAVTVIIRQLALCSRQLEDSHAHS